MAQEDENNEEVQETDEVQETQEPQESQFDMDKLEADTEDRLGAVFEDRPTPESSDEEEPEESEAESATPEGKAVEKADEPAAEESDSESEEPAADPNELSPAEIRAAVHMEWTEEEITELAKVNPGMAKRACAKALKATNELSKQFSELGKKAKEAEAASETPATPEAPAPKPKAKKVDLSAIQEQYGDDPIFGVVQQLADQNEALSGQLSEMQQAGDTRVTAKEAKADDKIDAATAQQIDTFFSGKEVADYADHYGTVPEGSNDWGDLTQNQITRRWNVVETAALILAGAESQSVPMEMSEAFQRAHLAEVAPIQATVQREKIKKDIVKRGKSLTLEPTSDAKATPTGALSRGELETVTSQRLHKVFN